MSSSRTVTPRGKKIRQIVEPRERIDEVRSRICFTDEVIHDIFQRGENFVTVVAELFSVAEIVYNRSSIAIAVQHEVVWTHEHFME